MMGKFFSGRGLPAVIPLTQLALLALGSIVPSARAQDLIAAPVSSGNVTAVTEFNTDVMDVEDRANIDVSHFSRAGYIMPGSYPLTLNVNGNEVREVMVIFAVPADDPHGSEPCLTSDIVELLGLKEEVVAKLAWKLSGERQCLNFSSLPGMTATGDLASGSLRVALPQAYLEYSAPDWDPPSRWDEGVSGLLFDYNVNTTQQFSRQSRSRTSISGNGTTGANLGPWRLRADWQAQSYTTKGYSSRSMQWSRYYLYRALPKLGAKLTVGETDLDSGLFDSFRFAGASIVTDDSMLPPNLQGYAPEVTGMARTNAKVIISQQGRVIYQTQVAQGPFRIQELSQATSGALDVRVEEADGRVQTFTVDTANIPYLTRPGMVRYKVAAGRPTDWKHRVQGTPFTTAEFSWGVSNGWSLFGGLLAAQHYSTLAVGIGRDLLAFGAISFDVTESKATLPGNVDKHGGSYRLSYSKRFEQIGGQVTFAGYRFSEKGFMSMSDYLEARFHSQAWGGIRGRQKELYTITASKAFSDLKMNIYGNYSHRTYWDRPDQDRYSLSLSKYLDIGDWKNISLSLTGYRSESWGVKDDGVYVSVDVPWGGSGSLSYSGQTSRNSGTSQTAGWYDNIDSNNTYSVQAGTTTGNKATANGYLAHNGDLARGSLSANYSEGSYSTVGMSVQGGATVTRYGAALHPSGGNGGTRLMIDTGDAGGVPLKNNGSVQKTNMFGKAVITGMGNYWRTSAGVDVDTLGDDMEVSHPITELTMTEGAIGYRKVDIMQGRKLMAVVKYSDGSSPAFGAVVWRGSHQTGVVDENGSVWLAGVEPGVQMEVRENENPVCRITIPQRLPEKDTGQPLWLTCSSASGAALKSP
ncbi:fimbria/pilus outer membrane usher protein [Rahnella laticis]|uniref:fimbria/pilus outer membrane usher protein n=1 Tax=Rahnella laticis TaxID=2787622 RepID=UPI0018A2F6A6|nr:fimbria/pilus outer membrane usher protein [Rahnella laticis]MBF7997762.1 fimbria/pilus outer membrane usher protein [Rahnella laticis]